MSTDPDAKRVSLLLVDDELRILSALSRSLRREGYEILTADSASVALELLGERSIDLVLTDQKMPEMSGLDLLAEVARRRPETARMLISGWTEAIPPETLEALDVRALIPKPWDDAELKSTLRAVSRGESRLPLATHT